MYEFHCVKHATIVESAVLVDLAGKEGGVIMLGSTDRYSGFVGVRVIFISHKVSMVCQPASR